jgi:hypothetical protein
MSAQLKTNFQKGDRPMREEISEPQQWRSYTRKKSGESGSSWFSRRPSANAGPETIESLPLEAVDAVFEEESNHVEPMSGSRRDMVSQRPSGSKTVVESLQSTEGSDLLKNLSTQLDMLKTQQEHLQKLLSQAQGE